MKQIVIIGLFFAAVSAFSASEAAAQTGVGVGVDAFLTGPVGPSVTYDADTFRVGGMFAFSDDPTQFFLGGRAAFVVHEGDRSDFAIGAGLGIFNQDNDPVDDETNFHLDAFGQLRAFLTSNVALNASLGLAVIAGDADTVDITGDLVGIAGIHYYFY